MVSCIINWGISFTHFMINPEDGAYIRSISEICFSMTWAILAHGIVSSSFVKWSRLPLFCLTERQRVLKICCLRKIVSVFCGPLHWCAKKMERDEDDGEDMEEDIQRMWPWIVGGGRIGLAIEKKIRKGWRKWGWRGEKREGSEEKAHREKEMRRWNGEHEHWMVMSMKLYNRENRRIKSTWSEEKTKKRMENMEWDDREVGWIVCAVWDTLACMLERFLLIRYL